MTTALGPIKPSSVPLPPAAGTRHGTIPAALVHSLGDRYHPDKVRLSRYRVYAGPRQQDVVDRLRAIVKDMAHFVCQGRGLVFYGSVGTGKDHLLSHALYAAAASGAICKHQNLECLLAWSDAGRIEDHIVRRLIEPDVLALSEVIPPAGWPSPWNVRDLLALIHGRYIRERPTWVSLNAESSEEAEEVLSAPVWSRLSHNAELFECIWADFRTLSSEQTRS